MDVNILTLYKAGIIDDLDLHFSRFILQKEKRDLTASGLHVIEIATALISRSIAAGNICLSEKDLEAVKAECGPSGEFLPSWSDICTLFKDAPWCSDGKLVRPVVFDGERFYLYRYWNYESKLAGMVKMMSSQPGMFNSKADEAADLASGMFRDSASYGLQMKAVTGVFSRRFNVITGGPGTGKTTVIARIISIIWKLFPGTVVRLAAPTGKAAARINEALSSSAQQMKDIVDADILEKLNGLSGSSIHRLLGWMSGKTVFRHNSDEPLDADILIVDEASMVDLAMMSLLLEAVKPGASVILIGDKDQLASVEAGNVLGDIFRAASEGYIERDAVTEFIESYRFRKGTGIGELAMSIREGLPAERLEAIAADHGSEVRYLSSINEKAAKKIVKWYENVMQCSDRDEAFDAFEKFRILCATRNGRNGVEEVNRYVEKMLGIKGIIKEDGVWYGGRPVMVLENNYELELYNGDCGLIFDVSGEKRAFFRRGKGVFRTFPVAVLPKVETVYAMTVHKSQGSEYDSVMIVFPQKDVPLLTKELLYTAVTRAKTEITLIAGIELLLTASGRSAVRSSGLVSALKRMEEKKN